MFRSKEGLTWVVVGSLFVVSACSGGTEVIATPANPIQNIPEHISSAPTPSMEEDRLFSEQATKYYPELLTSGLILQESRTFPVDDEHMIIFNNLDASFAIDAEAVSELISMYKTFPKLQPYADYEKPVVHGDNNLREPKNIVSFLLPWGAPRTDWNNDGTIAKSSGLLGNDEVYLSFAMEKPQEITGGVLQATVRDELTMSESIELCQVMIEVKSDTVKNTIFLQEMTCNSLGIAHWFKIKGYSYEEYQSLSPRLLIGFSEQPAKLKIITFNKDVYDLLPVSQLVDFVQK